MIRKQFPLLNINSLITTVSLAILILKSRSIKIEVKTENPYVKGEAKFRES